MFVGAACAWDAARGSPLALISESQSFGGGLFRDLDDRGLLHLGQLGRGFLVGGGDGGGWATSGAATHSGAQVVLKLLESGGGGVADHLNCGGRKKNMYHKFDFFRLKLFELSVQVFFMRSRRHFISFPFFLGQK